MHNAEDFDIVIPMCNLSEYSVNYSMTSGTLRNYYRNEVNDDANKNYNNYRIYINKAAASNSLYYKTNIIGSTPENNNRFVKEVVAPLRYLTNFCNLSIFLINCNKELDLRW